MFHSDDNQGTGKKSPCLEPYRKVVLLQINPTPLLTHSTTTKFNKRTYFTEIHDSITKVQFSEGYTSVVNYESATLIGGDCLTGIKP